MAAEDGQLRWRWLPTGSSARLLPRVGVWAAPSGLVRDSPAVAVPWSACHQAARAIPGGSLRAPRTAASSSSRRRRPARRGSAAAPPRRWRHPAADCWHRPRRAIPGRSTPAPARCGAPGARPQERLPVQPGRCGWRSSQDLLPPMAVRLGPALPVPPGHLLLDRLVGDHDPALRRLVAARRATHRGIQDGPHDIIGNPLSRQVAAHRGRVQRVEDQQWLGFGNRRGGSSRSNGHREARGLDRGFCIAQLKASANLRSISVRQLSTTLIACSPRVHRLDPGYRHAPSRRQFLAAGQQVSGRKPGAPETSGPRFLASHPGRDHLKLRGRSGYVTGSLNARKSHSSRGRAGQRRSSCRTDLI